MSSQTNVTDSILGENDTQGYDMGGTARLDAVLQTNLPEPFAAVDEDNLKEGLPEGLSESMMERGQRWTMDNRIQIVNRGDDC